MITQYTRLLIDKATQEIIHCTSQDFPFADGWEPIEEPIEDDSAEMEAVDFEIDTDYLDVNFTMGVDQEVLRARKIMENFEVVSGQPQLKTDANVSVSDKVLQVSAVKPITETLIKVEMVIIIKAALDSSGSSEKKLLDSMRLIEPAIPDKIEDLKMVQIIRIKKAIIK